MKLVHMLSASAVAIVAVMGAGEAQAREEIRVVGSSTVFPFTTAVAERFGQNTKFPPPVVESTGTGGGMKLFCAGVGVEHADFTNASRRIKSSELELCASNGVSVIEIQVGFDGLAMAHAKGGISLDLTKEQVFKALAQKLPVDGKLVDNPYKTWSQVDPSLPNEPIVVLGPPPTSGTRDSFVELVMEEGCKKIDGAKELGLEKKACHAVREDGAFVEAGENDNLIVQKLEQAPNAVGIFGFSFLDQNSEKLAGIKIDGVLPSFETVADGTYPVARSMFIYAKQQHVGVIPGMKEFMDEYVSEDAFGAEGYLADKGLIPSPKEKRDEVRANVKEMKQLSM